MRHEEVRRAPQPNGITAQPKLTEPNQAHPPVPLPGVLDVPLSPALPHRRRRPNPRRPRPPKPLLARHIFVCDSKPYSSADAARQHALRSHLGLAYLCPLDRARRCAGTFPTTYHAARHVLRDHGDQRAMLRYESVMTLEGGVEAARLAGVDKGVARLFRFACPAGGACGLLFVTEGAARVHAVAPHAVVGGAGIRGGNDARVIGGVSGQMLADQHGQFVARGNTQFPVQGLGPNAEQDAVQDHRPKEEDYTICPVRTCMHAMLGTPLRNFRHARHYRGHIQRGELSGEEFDTANDPMDLS